MTFPPDRVRIMHRIYYQDGRRAEGRYKIPHGPAGSPVLIACAEDFLKQTGKWDEKVYERLCVVRTPEGKPEFSLCRQNEHCGRAEIAGQRQLKQQNQQRQMEGSEFCGLYVSVSHTGDFWVCLIADSPCGIDCQTIGERDRDVIRLTERYYLPEEQEAVKHRGKREFYRIWTRKESLGKLLGKGMFQAFPLPVLQDEESYGFQETELPGLDGFCTICMRDQNELSMPPELVSLQAEQLNGNRKGSLTV